MPDFYDPIASEVLTWDGVTTAPHPYNAIAFNLTLPHKTVEIGHLHGGRLLDILFPKALRDILVASDDVQPHPILPGTGWTSFMLQGEEDTDHALWLLRLSYLHHQARRRHKSFDEQLCIECELDLLNLGSELRALFDGWLGSRDDTHS